jgi:MFS transporter, ACS family, allantoate permease
MAPADTVNGIHDPEKAQILADTGISEDAIKSGKVVPSRILKHSHDADIALKAFAEYKGQVIVIDEATNKRLLRKIDLHLMPVNCKTPLLPLKSN